MQLQKGSRGRRLGQEPWTGDGGGPAAGAGHSSALSLRCQEDREEELRSANRFIPAPAHLGWVGLSNG